MSLLLGSVRCLRARMVIPWRGVWFVDADLDPDSATVTAADVPTGAQTLSITTGNGTVIPLEGTVDPKAVGRWVAGVPLRLVAGGGGWDQPVSAQDFQSQGGVSSLSVEQATAAEVGETIVDPQPTSLGLHWVRIAGPASQIFRCPDRDYYVDTAGVTHVGQWPAAAPDASVELLDWEPIQQRATLAGDALVLPGTVLTDPRFDGSFTVRDVEIVFEADGTMRMTAWCSEVAITRLIGSLTSAVRVLGGIDALTSWEYRIVTQTGALLDLQQVDNADGTPSPAPPLKNVQVWPGMQGLSGVYKSSSNVRVIFLSQGWANPLVVSFDAQLPTTATIDATEQVNVGPSAALVQLAGGTTPVAPQGGVVVSVFPSGTKVVGTLTSPTLNPTPPYQVPFIATMALPGVLAGTIQSGLQKVQGK